MGRTRLGGAGRLALFLLLINVVVLATLLAMQAWQARPRSLPELHGERVRLLVDETPRKPRELITMTGQTRAEPLPAPVAASVPAVAQPASGPLCYAVDLRSTDAFPRLRRGLEAAGIKSYELRIDGRLTWWVFWPPETDPVEQVRVVAAIGKAGLKDVAVIRQGTMANAISLGVFASRAAAQNHWQMLRRKGLAKVEFGPRPSVASGSLELGKSEAGRAGGLQAALQDGPALSPVACARGGR